MKTLIALSVLVAISLMAAEKKSPDESIPFFNEKMGKALSVEFQRLRDRMQALEVTVTGNLKEGAETSQKSVETAGKAATKAGKKALVNLARELERTAKELRKKAAE